MKKQMIRTLAYSAAHEEFYTGARKYTDGIRHVLLHICTDSEVEYFKKMCREHYLEIHDEAAKHPGGITN